MIGGHRFSRFRRFGRAVVLRQGSFPCRAENECKSHQEQSSDFSEHVKVSPPGSWTIPSFRDHSVWFALPAGRTSLVPPVAPARSAHRRRGRLHRENAPHNPAESFPARSAAWAKGTGRAWGWLMRRLQAAHDAPLSLAPQRAYGDQPGFRAFAFRRRSMQPASWAFARFAALARDEASPQDATACSIATPARLPPRSLRPTLRQHSSATRCDQERASDGFADSPELDLRVLLSVGRLHIWPARRQACGPVRCSGHRDVCEFLTWFPPVAASEYLRAKAQSSLSPRRHG